MAGRNTFREEDLRQVAFNVKDMLSQLESAKVGQSPAEDFQPRKTTRGKKMYRGRGRGSFPKAHQESYDDYPDEFPDYYSRPRGRSRGRGRESRGRPPYRPPSAYEGPPRPQHYWYDDDRSPSPDYRYYDRRSPYRQERACQPRLDSPRDRVSMKRALGPKDLVDALVKYPDFRASLLLLMEDGGLPPAEVRDIVMQYPRVFDRDGEAVELRPEITICAQHSGSEGCRERTSCKDLHLCRQVISKHCNDHHCIFGHKWRTDHNIRALRAYFIDNIPVPRLQKLLESCFSSASPVGKIDICQKYNTTGCDQDDCSALHVCLKFVSGRTRCQRKNCPLNHNLLNAKCSDILSARGFSTNESPRDIVAAILAANPDLAERDDENSARDEDQSKPEKKSKKSEEKKSNKSEEKKSKRSGENKSKDFEEDSSQNLTEKEEYASDASDDDSTESKQEVQSTDSSSSSETDSSDSSSLKTKNVKKSTNRSPKKKVMPSSGDSDNESVMDDKQKSTKSVEKKAEVKPKLKTVWSHDFRGDVQISEICFYSVEGMCRNEESGCPRLHSSEHFHWQVTEQGQHWCNLPDLQVESMERSFCSPGEDTVDLPRLDPTALKPSSRGLLILMGRDTWSADFKAMTLTNSSKSKTLTIRRLYTEHIEGKDIKPASFAWYFLDIQTNWIQYGQADTTGDQKLVVSATCNDIEKHYHQNPKGTYSFTSSKFQYVLDFQTMRQTNQKTRVSREVRRRPMPHLQDLKQSSEDESKPKDLPSSWEIMQKEERVRLVTVAPSSSEYQTVAALLNNRVSASQLVKIERIQNPYLWRAFENKVGEMTTVLGDATKVDIRQVFHGTKQEVTSSICGENFDWRLHGSSTGQMYGRGTYFSTDAAYSYNYAAPDGNNLRYMFVARVAVGAFTQGNSSMVRPPPNPATNTLFDSTVDNEGNPTIVVKYDKQEYYPEYLMTMT